MAGQLPWAYSFLPVLGNCGLSFPPSDFSGACVSDRLGARRWVCGSAGLMTRPQGACFHVLSLSDSCATWMLACLFFPRCLSFAFFCLNPAFFLCFLYGSFSSGRPLMQLLCGLSLLASAPGLPSGCHHGILLSPQYLKCCISFFTSKMNNGCFLRLNPLSFGLRQSLVLVFHLCVSFEHLR